MYNLLTFLFILFVNSLFAQQEVYEIKSTAINTPYAEFGTIYLKGNGVLFASSKKNIDDKSFNKNRKALQNSKAFNKKNWIFFKNNKIFN